LAEVANGHYGHGYPRQVTEKENENDAHVLVNCVKRSQQAYDLNLGSVYADRPDYETVERFEVNFSDGGVCPRTYRVDEAFEGFLSDDDLVNYVKEYEHTGAEGRLENVHYRSHYSQNH
jgi:hypothetical protein